MTSLLKLIGGPGSISLLALASALGVALIYVRPRHRALGRVWLAALYLGYLVLALPVVAAHVSAPMADPLAGVRPIAFGIDTLLVLDGDNRWGRVHESMRVWSAVHPELLLVSGDPWLRDRLLDAGIPRARIVLDESSSTTREQITYVRRYASQNPRARIAILASRLQMPRVVALADRAAVHATFISAPVDQEPPTGGVRAFVPTYAALRVSRDALYERVAIAYYEWQGWIAPERLTLSARAQ